jgi:hypothetical protein
LSCYTDEVEKYINQVAFSGAEEFLEKYKDSAKDSGIIGHFGLGFYSAFIGYQRKRFPYIEPSRLPTNFTNDVESINTTAAEMNAAADEEFKKNPNSGKKRPIRVARIELPPGGMEAAKDGKITEVVYDENTMLILTPDLVIDLNTCDTMEVYDLLKAYSDDIVDLITEQRNDVHVHAAKKEVHILEGERGDPGRCMGVEGANLQDILVLDKVTGRPSVVVHDDEDKESVILVPLTDDEYDSIKTQLGLTEMPI